ncbi:MAG: hypothetical protein PUG66_09110 [Clostridiales bacterium]|nr:hypothetical protein [Clostridiales bacterium]
MKCDYCKIHYEENEGVCPNCGMTPRKRWVKILCAVAEVIFWMVWIMMIPVAWGEARIGHPVIALVADILALPSSYYLIRRFLGRKHRNMLAGIRAAMIILSALLFIIGSTGKYQMSEFHVKQMAESHLKGSFAHDKTFEYGTCESIKYFRDENESYVFWAEVTMSYQVKDGEGNPVSKQQTYIIKWNATNDNYEWYGAKKE